MNATTENIGARAPGEQGHLLSTQLKETALNASYEIEALLNHGVDLLGLPTAEDAPYALRGVLLRAHALNSVLMTALGDDAAQDHLSKLEREVFGHLEADRREAERREADGGTPCLN